MSLNTKENESKLRRLKHLTYLHHEWSYSSKKFLEELANIPYTKNARNKELLEIFQLAEDLGLDELELRKIWYSQRSIRYEREKEYRKKPQKEGRDNKDVYVGSSGDNRNKIRYPSKKRSRSTWKKFYALFPRVAERDGWDGKSSKKMK